MTDPTGPAAVWVLGARGMIGRALTEALAATSGTIDATPARPCAFTTEVPWQDREAVPAALQQAAQDYRTSLGGLAPTIVWAAGTAVIGSDVEAHATERAAFGSSLDALRTVFAPTVPTGHLLLVSSAGGVYAGSRDAPFDERTEPVPLSEYGRSKLAQEEQAIRLARDLGWTVTVARVANVYGLRQSVTKQQGIVSRLCRAAVFGETVDIFVPEGTARHYVHATDVGRMLARQLDVAKDDPGANRVRVISAGSAVTLRQLVDTVTAVSAQDLPVTFRASAQAEDHGVDLQLASCHADAILADPIPLEAGVRELLEALERSGPSMEPGAHRP